MKTISSKILFGILVIETGWINSHIPFFIITVKTAAKGLTAMHTRSSANIENYTVIIEGVKGMWNDRILSTTASIVQITVKAVLLIIS